MDCSIAGSDIDESIPNNDHRHEDPVETANEESGDELDHGGLLDDEDIMMMVKGIQVMMEGKTIVW